MTQLRPITVLIVDDSALIRQCLRRLLAELPSVQVVAEAENAEGAIAAFDRLCPDAAILDLELRQSAGMDVLDHIKRVRPACLTVVLTTLAVAETRRLCLENGADYFLDKPTEFEQLLQILSDASQPSSAK